MDILDILVRLNLKPLIVGDRIGLAWRVRGFGHMLCANRHSRFFLLLGDDMPGRLAPVNVDRVLAFNIAILGQRRGDLRPHFRHANVMLKQRHFGLRHGAVFGRHFDIAAGRGKKLIDKARLARVHRVINNRNKNAGIAIVELVVVELGIVQIPIVRNLVGPLHLPLKALLNVLENLKQRFLNRLVGRQFLVTIQADFIIGLAIVRLGRQVLFRLRHVNISIALRDDMK